MAAFNLPTVTEQRRFPSPAPTPQALTWHSGSLWMGSRDLRRIYSIDPEKWKVSQELESPGIPWAAVSTGGAIRFTIGVGTDDDRYVCRFIPGKGFVAEDQIACPDFTGSYLSYDGESLYLSQWYKHQILELSLVATARRDRAAHDRRASHAKTPQRGVVTTGDGEVLRVINVGAEISGHTCVDGMLYVLRGTEADGESWRIARLDPRAETPVVQDLATVPFPCRSLAHDGARFWSNHRAADAIVSFTLPS